MQRCISLALNGAGYVAPNPMVGAVLVYNDTIIGEGWHRQYGQPHAEVNCISDAVSKGQSDKIRQSTLFVSLEPCAHFGKTPPCADLIIQQGIPNVVIGCRDPFPQVNGKGIEKLQAAGVQVETGLLETECRELNKRFFTYHEKQRPYVILKWAQTADGFIAPPGKQGNNNERWLISNEYTNRLVHQWRSEEAAILVGTNTALLDDPMLTNRLWNGPSPVRLVIDRNLRLPGTLRLFNKEQRTIIFNDEKEGGDELLSFYRLDKNKKLVPQLMKALYELRLQSVLVEGGAATLQSFIEEGCWDEARVITATGIHKKEGLPAPVPANSFKANSYSCSTDLIEQFQPTNTP